MTEPQRSSDHLFQSAERLAQDYSLFPRPSDLPIHGNIGGLLSHGEIQDRLAALRAMGVDEYITETIRPTEEPSRLGAATVLRNLPWKINWELHRGPLYAAEMLVPMVDQERRVGFLAQDRATANGVWMPEHHLEAVAIIRDFSTYMIPIVTLMDTPGADAGEEANLGNQAHTISKLIAEMAQLHVPTVGIVLGIGYSGGAIPLATTNLLLSVRDGVFSTIQPRGLANIARKYDLSWQECAKSVGVSPYELCKQRYLDGIIDYVPGEESTKLHNLSAAITSGILAVERLAMHFVDNYDEIFEHYKRSVKRFLTPSQALKYVQADGGLSTLKRPTNQINVFSVAYRYLRYVGLRRRISSTRVARYGRLSVEEIPRGDLSARLLTEHKKAFAKWRDSPLAVRYDDTLARSWRHFMDALAPLEEARGRVARFFFGTREENLANARQELGFEYGFHLYNLWKDGSQYNFLALIDLLLEAPPVEPSSPEEMTVTDVLLHPEVRGPFIEQSQNLLIFDLLYDNIIANLVSIAGEAKDQNAISRQSVARLLEASLTKAIRELVVRNRRVVESEDAVAARLNRQFSSWIRSFVRYRRRGDLLKAVGEWKKAAFPRVSPALFAIVTFFLEHLLPDYFHSERTGRVFNGRISPRNIGVKDFWNRVNIAYQDLLLVEILQAVKRGRRITPQDILERFFVEVREVRGDLMTADPVDFPGFRVSIEDALSAGVTPCGTVTALARFRHQDLDRRVGVVVSNLGFQAGSFDMASGEKFAKLLVTCAELRLPVVCFISSGGMQTKEGAGSLFSMAIINDRITRFVRDNDLPVLCFGFGDCTGGAQASLVTHPLVWTYYFSGANMPFAGQIVVPSYLPLRSTLSNYLALVEGSMNGLVQHPFAPELDEKLRGVDPTIPIAEESVEEVIARTLKGRRRSDRLPEAFRLREHAARPKWRPVNKVLIHARGCTASKLIRVAQETGRTVVLVQSDPDMDSVPASMLGERDTLVCLGGSTPDESYLNALSVIRIAEQEGVDSLHPGIGFLAENADFARLCRSHAINFIGPRAASMERLGNKSNAIQTATRLEIPVVAGSHGILTDPEAAASLARSIGYPVIIKAVHGGGGKGIRVVSNPSDFLSAFLQITAEAKSAFGNSDCYVEKYITSLRHVEVQILRDRYGHTQVLGLRDCSVQRNKQKIIEESASTGLPQELCDQTFHYARALADEVDYLGAGTVEFIFDVANQSIYFMEMNARLQVEHPVTEAVTGIDIVAAQFDIAAGESIEAMKVEAKGYAVEARINAERIQAGKKGSLDFIPDPGLVTSCHFPDDPDVRVISCIAPRRLISPYYDNLVAQVIAYGTDRRDAMAKLDTYLAAVTVEGIRTNISLLRRILTDETFLGGSYDTNFLVDFLSRTDAKSLIRDTEAASGTTKEALGHEAIAIEGSDELRVLAPSTGIFYLKPGPNEPDLVTVGQRIDTDRTLCLIEAMKLFREITLGGLNQNGDLYQADREYEIVRVNPANGQAVSEGDLLFVVKPVAA